MDWPGNGARQSRPLKKALERFPVSPTRRSVAKSWQNKKIEHVE
jgi:hypothetical protein